MAGALGYLGVVNLILAVFNLIPGLPLDGGRVLRSALWKGTGDLQRATKTVSRVGEVIGYLMMVVGLLALFGGALAGGIWLAAIGWFLAGAARSSYTQVQIHHLLEGVRAEDVMTRSMVEIPAEVSVRKAVDEYFLRYDQSAFPVEDEGHTIGVVTLDAVKATPREQWSALSVEQIAEPVDRIATVAPEAPVEGVLARLDNAGVPVFVGDDGRIVGEITPLQLGRYLSRRRAIAAKGGSTPEGRPRRGASEGTGRRSPPRPLGDRVSGA